MSEPGTSTADGEADDDPALTAEPDASRSPSPVAEPDTDAGSGTGPDAEDQPPPSWWHRSHPTFAGLVGFFTGVAYVIVVPGVYAALLGLLLSDSSAQRLFPLIVVALLVPLALLVPRKTRRFAQFMLLGVVSTVVVVGLTTALVLWVMVRLAG